MTYFNLIAKELYLFSSVNTLSCPTCYAWMYIPDRGSSPISMCYCYTLYRDNLYNRYAKYRNYGWHT